MLKHLDLGDQSPVEVREAQSVNGLLAVLNHAPPIATLRGEELLRRTVRREDAAQMRTLHKQQAVQFACCGAGF